MRSRRKSTRAGQVVALALACSLAPRAASATDTAQGVIDLSWNTCSPIVTTLSQHDTGPVRLVASVLGNDFFHLGYSVQFLLAAPDGTVPDAWRFDTGGCQGSGALEILDIPPPDLAAGCPSFHQSVIVASIRSYGPASIPDVPPTVMQGVFAGVSAAPTTSDPAQRYFLAAFIFDHAGSVTGPTIPGQGCGGYETPITVRLLATPAGQPPENNTSEFLSGDGTLVYPFLPGNTTVTVDGPVPADRSTWGQIKSIYRR